MWFEGTTGSISTFVQHFLGSIFLELLTALASKNKERSRSDRFEELIVVISQYASIGFLDFFNK